ncbi:MAG: YciI family protein [Thermoplasmata archaeon]|nr:YciI family protein [Thermoplasmata archaeon]MCI4356108.1 YciI family protein [Thermoplasmata archaeon]
MTGAPTPEAEEIPPGMVRYLLGFLTKGPHWGEGSEAEREAVQREHVANNRRLQANGAQAVSGPLLDHSDLRGILISRDAPEARIRELVAADPAIASGPLRPELRPFLAFDGLRTNAPP